MARPLRIEFPGVFYHVTSRGNERKAIFNNQCDREKFLGNKKHDRNLPILRALSNRPDMEQIIETVDSVIGSNDKLSRQIKLYLCHRYSGRKLKEIGTYFDIGESGVSHTTRRVSDKLEKDKKLIRKINRIKNKLNLSNV